MRCEGGALADDIWGAVADADDRSADTNGCGGNFTAFAPLCYCTQATPTFRENKTETKPRQAFAKTARAKTETAGSHDVHSATYCTNVSTFSKDNAAACPTEELLQYSCAACTNVNNVFNPF